MNTNEIVYIVEQSSVYDMRIKNSTSIYKGRVLAIKDSLITVEIEVDSDIDSKAIIQQYDKEALCKTPQQALERASNLIMTKDIKDEQTNIQ